MATMNYANSDNQTDAEIALDYLYGDKEAKTPSSENTPYSSNVQTEYRVQPKKKSKLSSIIKFLVCLLIIILSVYVIRLYVLEPFVIPSGSMEPTIEINDHVLTEKITYNMEEPKIGDIVTFYDINDPDTILIKRIVATEGQTVDFRDDQLVVNDMISKENYINNLPSESLKDMQNADVDITYPYVVPKGHVWVMGDNRINSSDSRVFGAVPVENIIGKAIAIYAPFDRIQMFN